MKAVEGGGVRVFGRGITVKGQSVHTRCRCGAEVDVTKAFRGMHVIKLKAGGLTR